ncbi:MAG TPA: glycosyl hydrolase, partial [Gemmatimonadota bacterium]|nr:glycosyl hydrolase [Gemmatimonadota bacterium]
MKPRTVVLALLVALLPAAAPLPAAAQFFGRRAPERKPDTVALSAMDARSIGPATMSGRIGDVVGVRGTRDTLFVGAATGGVWESTDGGTTFEPIFDKEPALSIGEIAVHPTDHDVIWVGTGEDNPRNSVGIGKGMFRSVDGGKTWKHVGLEKSE